MGLFGGGNKTTTNVTENKTDVYSTDKRIAAADEGIALGEGASLDQSIYFSDKSSRDNSVHDNRVFTDQSDNRTFTQIETLADDVALGVVDASRKLGEGAFSLVSDGLAAQAAAQRENRLLAENALGAIQDSTRDTLEKTLSVLENANARAGEQAAAGQAESAAARVGAQETIKEVLGFKEAGDTKVAQDLIKYGAIAAAIFAAIFIFRPSRRSN